MKIIQISDIHLNSEPILGHDPLLNFQKCLHHIEDYQADADRIIITGDLTHHGRPENYQMLQNMLAQSTLKDHQKPRLMIGNHDNRAHFLDCFSDAQTDANGFVQWVEDVAAGRFVYMDTVKDGDHAGCYCDKRQAWLDNVLRKAADDGVRAYLFMHHNPLLVHVANADTIGIDEAAELQKLLARHRDSINHIFFGHCHYSLSGMVARIPFSAARSTNHTCWPDFSDDPYRMGHGQLQPNYNVGFLNGDDSVIHSIDFLDQDKVEWQITGEDGWFTDPDSIAK